MSRHRKLNLSVGKDGPRKRGSGQPGGRGEVRRLRGIFKIKGRGERNGMKVGRNKWL